VGDKERLGVRERERGRERKRVCVRETERERVSERKMPVAPLNGWLRRCV